MSDQAITNAEINPASQRHWLYGFNVAILVLVGTALVGLVMYLCETGSRGKVAWDVTSSGVNSLSGSTKALIKEVDDSKKDFVLVSLFIDPSATEKANGDPNKQAEKRRQVLDLLNLYARNGSHIRVED